MHSNLTGMNLGLNVHNALNNLKASLGALQGKIIQLQQGLMMLKKSLTGESAEEKSEREKQRELLAQLHGNEATQGLRTGMQREFLPAKFWGSFVQNLASSDDLSGAFVPFQDFMKTDPAYALHGHALYAGCGIYYILEPIRELEYDSNLGKTIDHAFDYQTTCYDNFVNLLNAMQAFKINGKLIDFPEICKEDNLLIKNYDLFLDEVELCCKDFMAGIEKRYKKQTTLVDSVEGDRSYDATGEFCPKYDVNRTPSFFTLDDAGYENAKEYLTNGPAAYDRWVTKNLANDWNQTQELVNFFRETIKAQTKEDKQILKDILPVVKWRTQGMLLTYILLDQGFADPEFLWWATGAILFYRGQGDHGQKNPTTWMKQYADFSCYKLLQIIKNDKSNLFHRVQAMCGMYTEDFLKKFQDIGYTSQIASGDDTNLKGSITIATQNLETRFTGAIKCFGGGNGYTRFGAQAKADILGMIRARRLMTLVEQYRIAWEQKQKDDADKTSNPGKLSEKHDEEISKLAVALAAPCTIKIKKDLAGLLPLFEKIAEYEVNKDIIAQAQSVVSTGGAFDLCGYFAYFYTNHNDLLGDTSHQDAYKKILSCCTTIVRNILKSVTTIERIAQSSGNELEQFVIFVRWITKLPADNFDMSSGFQQLVADEINNEGSYVHAASVKSNGVNVLRLCMRASVGVAKVVLQGDLDATENALGTVKKSLRNLCGRLVEFNESK